MTTQRVRCKFKLSDITMRRGHAPQYKDGKHVGYAERILYDAEFIAVHGDSGAAPDSDNQRFWEATPSGTLKLTTVRMMPWEEMLGREFYVDVIPAEVAAG